MTDDPFARSIESIDMELHEQVQKRDNGLNEILHGIFVVERTGLVIERLIEERLKASKREVTA